MAASTIALNATTGLNFFSNEAHGVINVFHRDLLRIPATKDSAKFGQVVTFEIDKTHDYWDYNQLELVTSAATFTVPQTVEQYVDGAGYRMMDNVKITLTNNQLNSYTVPYLWNRLKDLLYYTDETRFKKRENYLADQTALFLRSKLASGHTFIVDIDAGWHMESKECLMMTSACSARVKIEIKLARPEEIIDLNGVAASNVTNITDLISSVTLLHPCLHINADEREVELNKRDEPDGIFTLIHKFEVQEQDIPIGRTGAYNLPITLTGTYTQMLLVFRPTAYLDTDYAQDPIYWTGPSMTVSGGNVCYMPDELSVSVTNGTTAIAPRMSTQYNRTELRKRLYPNAYGGDWTLLVPFSEDPFALNAILGTYDFNVFGSRTLNLYWNNGAVTSSGTAQWRLTIIAVGPDYRQHQKGTVGIVFG